MLNLKTDFGAVGNGTADDTTPWQNALNSLQSATNALYVPLGTYRITQTLSMIGTPGLGVHIYGDIGATRGPSGSQLLWDGATDATMVQFIGLNGSLIENLEFNCNLKANRGLWLDAQNTSTPAVGPGGSGVILRRLLIAGLYGPGICLALGRGNPATEQVSECAFYDCLFQGQYAGTGIKTLNSGNVKNFAAYNCTFAYLDTAIDWLKASGTFVVDHPIIADVRTCFMLGSASMSVRGAEVEADNCRLATGNVGANPGTLLLENCSFQCAAPADDVVVSYGGSIILLGNQFLNYRTSSSIPRIVAPAIRIGIDAGASGCLHSIGNWYMNAPAGYAPFYDGSGNPLLEPGSYYQGKDMQVVSLGDYGGTGGALTRLKNHVPAEAVPIARPLNLKTDFGAIGDGVTDDTAAWQNALNAITDVSKALYVPTGYYKVTSTLTFTGSPSFGIHLYGEHGSTGGLSGATIEYAGPAGGAVLHFLGLCSSLIEHLDIRGGDNLAKYGLWLDAGNTESPPTSGGSSSVRLDHVGIGVSGTDSVALALGHPNPSTMQVDSCVFDNCMLSAQGSNSACIRTLNAGNVKQFHWRGGTLGYADYAIDWQLASGCFTVRDLSLANIQVCAFVVGGGEMLLEGVEDESGTAHRFAQGNIGLNANFLNIMDCSFQSALPDDDILISFTGAVNMIGNRWLNYRTASSVPKIVIFGTPAVAPVSGQQQCSIYSAGNFYHHVPAGYGPFYDSYGNALLGPTGTWAGVEVQVVSLGDTGGEGGALTRLRNTIPREATRRD